MKKYVKILSQNPLNTNVRIKIFFVKVRTKNIYINTWNNCSSKFPAIRRSPFGGLSITCNFSRARLKFEGKGGNKAKILKIIKEGDRHWETLSPVKINCGSPDKSDR